MGKKILKGILLVFLVWTCSPYLAEAAESEYTEEVLGELKLQEIEKALEELPETVPFRFVDGVKELLQGDFPLNFESIRTIIQKTFFSQVSETRATVIRLLLLITVAAVFTNFASAFEKSQVADISFYMIYLLLFTILMRAFQVLSQLTSQALEQVLSFIKLLIPSYFVASVFASKSISGGAFYELTLVLLLVIQWILKYFAMPAINLYVLFGMIDHLTKEDYFSKLAEFVKAFVEWTMKTLAAVAVGVQTVQNLILPAVDSLKTTVINRTAGAIPGVGNIFTGVTEVLLGSAVLIKHAVGVAGLIVLLLLCLVPLIKLGVSTFLYKLLAALVQPISDKRIVGCISSVGEGTGLLLRVLLTVGLLFFISVAMATAGIGG